MTENQRPYVVLGARGKLGSAMVRELATQRTVFSWSSDDFDARDHTVLRKWLTHANPAVIVNCIGYLGIDACERHPSDAFDVNALLPRALAAISADIGAKLIHISTDAVFPNLGTGFYCEHDTPRPLNIYGATKAIGDTFVQNFAPSYLIIRVSMLFGESPKGGQFAEAMLARARKQQPLQVSNDVWLSASYNRDIASQTAKLLEQSVPSGLYHVANLGAPSLYELTCEMLNLLELNTHVTPVSHATFPSVGVKNTRTPLISVKVPMLRPWQDALTAWIHSDTTLLK